eukprot:CAMPEP_0198206190 /NCGR_PEP_ID=MMETSP1445-20131203/9726_1 /TAXON_ID=36898 /ORGANISM="Pyramimonas sp., Strain CCMP2087" /LENGTH=126 /DNA_ID=CAMNT_0043878795 /DNA_START=215 /DNA_END=595 /DNA_ORIENTATION=-
MSLEALDVAVHGLSGPQEVFAQLATSNLGFIDAGADLPPSDWSPAQSYDKFEPGGRLDPGAVFACLLVGLVGVDATLQSMNVPFIGRWASEYLKKKRSESKDRDYKEFQKKMEQQQTNKQTDDTVE